MRLRPLAALAGAAALLLTGFTPATDASTGASYIVQLHGTPAGPAQAAAERAGEAFDRDAYEAGLVAEQDALLADLAEQGIDLPLQELDVTTGGGTHVTAVEARLTFVLHAIGVIADPADVEAIEAHRDVRAVHADEPVRAHMDESVDYVNAPAAWEDPGVTGAGQSVAVLDTGIDWTHPMFGADVTPPSDLHEKVKHYETWTAGHHDGHGHGTHVAGTAAGASKYGDTLLGPARFDGPAKDADIWAYKVLSDAGTGLTLSVVMGIESAAARGADVQNLSLGSDDGDPNAPTSQAVNNATAAGSIVSTSAGNAGPGYSTIGSPASAHDAITVGSSTDTGDFAYFAVPQDGGRAGEEMEIIPLAGSPIPEEDQVERYVDCGLALSPTDCGAEAAGKIALIERGGTPFTAKAASAEAAGAIAAIIYNNEPGNFAGTLIVVEPGIPVAAMSQEDGHALLEHVEGGVSTIDLALTWGDPHSIEGQLSGFSSRGPNDDWVLKPDVVAPGNNITAPVPRAGQLASLDGYGDAGGTSMSAPHISGIAALLTEARPDWTPQMVKTAIMNTAVQLTNPETGDLYSVLDQGAGLVDAHAAVNAPALIGEAYQDHEIHPDGELARGSVSFGQVEVDGRTTVTKPLTVVNVSDSAGRWRLAWEPADAHDRHGEGRDAGVRGFDLRFERRTMRVAGGETAATNVTLTLDPSLDTGDYEGRIVATDGETTLRIPVYVRVESDGEAAPHPRERRGPPHRDDTSEYAGIEGWVIR
jgi:minor extracellular serine protease Vpr